MPPKAAEKLLKYFPAEAFALYAALDPVARTIWKGAELGAALWVMLAIALVFLVFFLRRFWVVNKVQIVISCGAFALYVAALGGPFASLSGWNPAFGLLGAIIATAFMIFIKAPTAPE